MNFVVLKRTIVNSTLTSSRASITSKLAELNLIKFGLVLKEQERKRQTKKCDMYFSICIFNTTYLHVYSSLI